MGSLQQIVISGSTENTYNVHMTYEIKGERYYGTGERYDERQYN